MRARLNQGVIAAAAGCLIAAAPAGCPGGEVSSAASTPFRVQVPPRELPFPEPLGPGREAPGFRFRGIKGWDWTTEQYLEEIPYLAKFRMNFLMNCYLSLFTHVPGEPLRNEWWKPLGDARRRDFGRIIGACREQGIDFCFCVNPQLESPRPLDPARGEDVDLLYQHYAWAQGLGARWFSVCLDDVGWGPGGPAQGGAAHARLADTLLGRLRAGDPQAQLILCPVAYWGDGTDPARRAYLESLGRSLHPDIYVFWTGDSVYARRITRRAAQSYRSVVNHRLFLWDNYPVNDGNPTLHLGPVSGRESGLCETIDGYMGNPMHAQSQINRIPMATCADYAYNPWAYDPGRSVGQAILRLAEGGQARRALGELVEAYPGFIVSGGDSATNPVRRRFLALRSAPGGREEAALYLRRVEELGDRLGECFPGRYGDARAAVAEDIAWMGRQEGGPP